MPSKVCPPWGACSLNSKSHSGNKEIVIENNSPAFSKGQVEIDLFDLEIADSYLVLPDTSDFKMLYRLLKDYLEDLDVDFHSQGG